MAAFWHESGGVLDRPAARTVGLQVGQRYHRVGLPTVIWTVVRVYRDAQGVDHARLANPAGRLDEKTLSATVLLDRSRYRLV